MQLLVDLIKEFLIPGSAWFLIIATSISAGLLSFAQTRGIGRRLVAATAILYWVMSVPLVAHGLQRAVRVQGTRVESVSSPPREPIPIVVLGNGLGGYAAVGARFEVPLGQTAMNALFAVERYRQYPGVTVIASGGPEPGVEDGTPEAVVIRDGLVRNGVPAERVVLEPTSANTHEQVIGISKILAVAGERRCVLVTSPQQMTRALDLFRREGITAFPLAADSPLWTPSRTAHWWSWLVPSTEARAVSRDVVYEWMAWPYYWMRGWIS